MEALGSDSRVAFQKSAPNSIDAGRCTSLFQATSFPAASRSSLSDLAGFVEFDASDVHIELNQRVEDVGSWVK